MIHQIFADTAIQLQKQPIKKVEEFTFPIRELLRDRPEPTLPDPCPRHYTGDMTLACRCGAGA